MTYDDDERYCRDRRKHEREGEDAARFGRSLSWSRERELSQRASLERYSCDAAFLRGYEDELRRQEEARDEEERADARRRQDERDEALAACDDETCECGFCYFCEQRFENGDELCEGGES